MGIVHDLQARCYGALLAPDRVSERGDVPGWVLITVMSAGIVVALGATATDQLSAMMSAALSKVK
jgi:hypothetical protein